MNYTQRLNHVIPGGAHTYSRGFDQFPHNAPSILERGKGAYVFDVNNQQYLDYGMALRAVNIGYAEERINQAAIRQIEYGNNLTRPSLIELEAAELLVHLIDSVDMVKFTKNGSTATTAAVKLARAYTGRELIARCAQHPFFSYDDWFIGSTPMTKGIPNETIEKTKIFHYNNIESLEILIADYPEQIACVMLEPANVEEPQEDFLQKVQEICHQYGIVFILDEMITGFRWHIKGAQYYYHLQPDLCTFGKAMANGFSVACIAGKREIMQLGSIDFAGQERVFLLSTTHGAEMSGLGAFVATINFMHEHDVIKYLWDYGQRLIALMNDLAHVYGIAASFKAGGFACSPYYVTLDQDGQNSFALRTLFMQEMIKYGVLMPWIAICYRHGDEEFEMTKKALAKTFEIYRLALNTGVEKYLEGPIIKPVFRRYN